MDSKVEIRGTLDNANRSGAGATTGATAGGTGSTAAGSTGSTAAGSTGGTMSGMSHGNNQQLRVTSVRQVASSCSGQ